MPYKFNPFTGTFDDSTTGPQGPAGTVSAAGSGTAAAPGIAFASDPNTGIYNPSADNIAISTGGTGRLFVGATGFVGMNTGADTPLSIKTISGYFRIRPAGGLGAEIDFSNGSTNATTATISNNGGSNELLQFNVNNGSGSGSLIFNTVGSERLRITSAGNVGIGTTSPLYPLHVEKNQEDLLALVNTGVVTYRFQVKTDASLAIVQNSTERARIDSSGRLGLGTSSPKTKLDCNLGSGELAFFGGQIGTASGLYTGIAFGYSNNSTSLVYAKSAIVQEQIGDGAFATGKIHILNNNTAGSANAGLADARLTITPAGNVGIGITSPLFPLDVNGVIYTRGRGSTFGVLFDDWRIYNSTSPGALVFDNGTERARIDSSGRLLVGTSTARTTQHSIGAGGTFDIVPFIQHESTGNAGGFSAVVNKNDASGSLINLAKTRGTTSGSNTIVAADDVLGTVGFFGADGNDITSWGGAIQCFVDGTPGANDMPGRLVFSTTADGAAAPSERMRIDSAGRVLVGTATANTSGAKLQTSDGITFPATAVASADPNTLDDYEEGTFTPTVIGSGTAGTATYNFQNGRYTKVGRIVHFEIFLEWSLGTGTGALRVSGLPFTSGNGITQPAVTVGGQNNIASSVNTYLNAYILTSSTQILIAENPIGGGARNTVTYDAAGEFMLSGTYSI